MKNNAKKAISLSIALALSVSNLTLLAKDGGWQQTNGDWIYIDNQGSVAKGWQLIETSWYVFDAHGSMQTGWVEESENWYFLGGSGVMQSNTWIENTDGTKYFIKGTGIMATDYVKDGFEFLEDGTAVPLGSTGSVLLTDTIALEGTTINGNLYVDAATANDLIINGVTVTGKLVIIGDNQSKAKITLVDSKINTISSQQRNSEIVLSGKTDVKNIVLQETATVIADETFKGQVEKFEIQSTTKGEVIVGVPSKEVSSRTYATVHIQAAVEKLEIKNDTNLKINANVTEIKVSANAAGTKVDVSEGNTVGKIDTESKIEVSGQGKVDEVTGAGKDDTTNVTTPEKPSAGGGGGGGNTTPPTIDVTGITLDTNLKIIENENETFNLVASVFPSNATNKKVKWNSTNNEIATVDEKGKVTALKFGKTTITATTINGSKTANCEVIIGKALESMSVTGKDEIYVDEKAQLQVTFSPEGASNLILEWESSDKKIATVDNNGEVTAIKAGIVKITAKNIAYGISITKEMVIKQYVKEIKFDKVNESLLVNESMTLNPTVTPEDATLKALTWSSSNTQVASVDSDGKVTTHTKGETTITVSATDGSKRSAECTIKVVEPVASIGTINYPTLEKALHSSLTGDKVILIDKNYEMHSNAEIKEGVTLVLPYKDDDKGYEVGNESNPASVVTEFQKYAEVLNSAYLSLTIPEDIELTVSGILIVNAETGIKTGGANHPNSNHDKLYAQINLTGKIVIKNSGILECPGFIKGEGTITAEEGSEINDLLDIFNWRGGSYAAAAYNGRATYLVYPMMESSISNIESEIILKGKASLAGIARIYAGSSYNNARFLQFGENGLIKTDTNTTITKKVNTPKSMDTNFDQNDYNYSTIMIDGDATFASGTINVGANVSTKDYFYPLSGTLTININNGTFKVSERMKMMKGSTINVGENATMIIDNGFAIYKEFTDPYTDPRRNSVVDKDRNPAKLNLLKGSILEINNAFAGEIHIDENCDSLDNKAIVKTGVNFTSVLEIHAIKTIKGFSVFTSIASVGTDSPKTSIGEDKTILKPNSEYHCYYEDGSLVVKVIQEEGIVPSNEELKVDDEVTEEEMEPTEENKQPEEENTLPKEENTPIVTQ